MILLYRGTGAQDVEVLDEKLTSDRWSILRGLSSKMLHRRGAVDACALLSDIPFELRDGTNGFRDEFQILYWSAPFDRYVEMAEWAESGIHKADFKVMATTVSEVTGFYIRFVAVELDTTEGPAVVETPNLIITSDVVERALSDAERLISSEGATSGIDRVHTAFHGYLEAACNKNKIYVENDASVTTLFKVLLKDSRAFTDRSQQPHEIDRILRAFSVVVDALNPIRNLGSMAHPNASLLDAPEAMLVINSVRTLLHYLNSKLS